MNKQDLLFVILPYESEDFKRVWEAWKLHRKDKKCPYRTLTQEQKALNLFEGFDEYEAIQCLRLSMAHGYQGFFPKKIPNVQRVITDHGKYTSSTAGTSAERINALREW